MATRPVFAKLDVAPAYQLVSQSVEELISSGTLQPGDWLPSETDLATQFGVNRSTVREGIRVLEHGGLVRRDGKRLKVAIPHYMDLASRASRALVMHQVTFRELWEASLEIECVTIGFAAARITDEGLQSLETNIAEMAAHIDDTDAVVALDVEFHDLIAEAAQNRALSLAREPISLLFEPAGKIILPRLQTQGRILDAHRTILALLRQRDAPAARAWMERHMADFKRGYERTGIDMDQPINRATRS